MTKWLVRTFVRNHENTKDAKVREHYGVLSSCIGIVINLILVVTKLIVGTMSNSIAITTDAMNNLSDSASSIVTLFAYKQAAKPADRDHPFGHGRMEYLIGLLIAVLILFVGVEFAKTSFQKILHPEPVFYSTIALVSIGLSIFMKLWMYFFNRTLGSSVNSSVMMATAKDSLSDVFATSVTMLSLLFSLVGDFPVDGYIGLVVSGIIMYAGYQIIVETVDTLIGTHAEPEVVDAMLRILHSKDVVLGVHDLIVHNYGPGKLLASAHVEVNVSAGIQYSHDQIDAMEREILEQLGISIVIHVDPVERSEFQEIRYQQLLAIVREIDEKLMIHDFYCVEHDGHLDLLFDIDIPFEHKLSDAELQKRIDAKLEAIDPNHHTIITFDRSFL